MRYNQKLTLAVLFISVAAFTACEKNLLESNRTYVFTDASKDVGLKIIHAYAGKAPALTSGAGPNLFMYLGNQKLNGNVLTYTGGGGFWPTTSTSTANTRSLYSIVPAGNATLYGVLGRVSSGAPAPNAGDTIFKATQDWVAGKNYSVFLTDTAQNPGVKVVEDNVGTIGENVYKLRFANMLAWSDVQQVFSKRENRNIFSNVAYKAVTDFIELPVPAIADTLTITKVSGNSTSSYTFTINGFRGQGKRAYTLYTKGKNLGTTSSSTFQNASAGVITVW